MRSVVRIPISHLIEGVSDLNALKVLTNEVASSFLDGVLVLGRVSKSLLLASAANATAAEVAMKAILTASSA